MDFKDKLDGKINLCVLVFWDQPGFQEKTGYVRVWLLALDSET